MRAHIPRPSVHSMPCHAVFHFLESVLLPVPVPVVLDGVGLPDTWSLTSELRALRAGRGIRDMRCLSPSPFALPLLRSISPELSCPCHAMPRHATELTF